MLTRMILALTIGSWAATAAFSAEFFTTPWCSHQPGKSGRWQFACPPGEPAFVYLVGSITKGDHEKLRELLRKTGPTISRIELRSPGGDVAEAMKIGQLVRSLYLTTYAPISRAYSPIIAPNCADDVTAVKKQVPCQCASACFLIFAAGVSRNGTEFYVHRIRYDKEYFSALDPLEAGRQYAAASHQVREYLKHMGIPDRHIDKMFDTASHEIAKLTDAESRALIGEIPEFSEWLTANCGGYSANTPHKKAMEIGNCRYKKETEARERAFKKVFGSN